MSEGRDLVNWADPAMFEAAPMRKDDLGRIKPQVFLLSATPDPLGAIAAAMRMYAGHPTYDLRDLTQEDRVAAWEDSLKTQLKAPWEFVDFHFFIEAVTRSFTHQMVRQRTAVFAQESLRFAVKRGLASEVVLPPSLVGQEEGPIEIWQRAVAAMGEAYEQLVDAGIPAEDARGLLPHAVTTRLNYKTNLRNLVEQAGTRLCTQAQFEWRHVFLEIIKAIRNYQPEGWSSLHGIHEHDWQFNVLGTPLAQTFAPVCYHAGHCTFMGDIDRYCVIRDRVQILASLGVPSSEWHEPYHPPRADGNLQILPDEWMANSEAARPQK